MKPSHKSTAGAVTAEFAVALPIVVLVIAMLINIIAAGIQQSQLHQAASSAARQLARGEAADTIEASVSGMTAASTSVATATNDQWATVELTSPIPGPLGLLPNLELTAQAKAPNQWTVEP